MKTMKFERIFPTIALGCLVVGATQSQAAFISLFDYSYNMDGVVTNSSVPPGVDGAGFDYATGLGTITYSFNTPGSHFAGLFVDHEIDEASNSFFNEVGTTVGAPAAGQSWEIDEPGFVFGNIYTNFLGSNATGSLLENANGVPAGSPDDVSMSMGWNFSLLAGESAIISFNLGSFAPTSGFYLQQFDPGSNASVFFSSQARFSGTPGGNGVPDGLNTGVALGCVSMLGIFCRWSMSKRPVRLSSSV